MDYFRRDYFEQPEQRDWFEYAMSCWGDKKYDARFPMGPYLVTMDEVGNPYELMIYPRQSGYLRDRSHTGAMNIGIERTISWLSSFHALQPGESFTGDTFLRLRNPSATQVATNDDACGGVGSQIVYRATVSGNFELRAGCYSTTSCNGTVAWTIQ